MEHLTTDAVRSFFVARMQLESFESRKHWVESHSLEGTAWLEDADQKALYMWMQEDSLRFFTMSLKGESEARLQDRLPAAIRQGVVTEFMYFYKRDLQKPCTNANLNTQVMFGCSRGDLLDNLLGLMNHVYVPVSLAHQGWPDNVKKDFTSQVQKFMSTVTEMTAQGKGQTVLYIPQDSFINLEAAAKDKDIVQRLEMALIYWTRQIKEVTTQQDSATEGEHSGPLDEIEFWHKRDNNLSRLHDQLQSANLQRLLKILEFSKSAYLKEFRSLEERIKNGSIEAKENLKFLSFLKEPCEKLSQATPPEIPKILPNLLNYVRMIWSVSSYYRKEDRISGLLRKMSNEIIKRCQCTIQLDDIFKNKGVNVENSMVQLQQCIDCGREWKEAYKRMTRLIAKFSDRACNFSDSTIFVQIDAFVQRCCDLLEVCECLQQFACYSRGQPMPVFGGSRSQEIEKSLRDIEDIFLRNLERLENVDYDLLNVTASGWQDDITSFRNNMRDLEVMYVNVINSSFDGVGTVQAAVEVLDAFYLLAKREKIKVQIMKKGEYVYNLFSEELNKIKREFEHHRKKPLLPIVQGHPIFAGTAFWVKGLMLRTQRQMDELSLLWYLEPCREQESAKELYSNVHSLLEDKVLQTFADWNQELKQMDADSSVAAAACKAAEAAVNTAGASLLAFQARISKQ
jgi:dynein heavy chain